jgi:ElaB/YqjD/DUF883 family membrane-anchored ribosome-binding protein
MIATCGRPGPFTRIMPMTEPAKPSARSAAALNAQLLARIDALQAEVARLNDSVTLLQSGPGFRDRLDEGIAALAGAVGAAGGATGAGPDLDEAAQSARAMLDDLSAHARRHPLQALAAAAGLGLILGLLGGRR